MENATKALLMVSAVLIGVMILALGAYLFSVFGNTTGSIEARIAQAQLDEFNSQFTKYDGQEDCTIHDIETIYFKCDNITFNAITKRVQGVVFTARNY